MATHVHAQDGVKDIQAMLAECGFNPGPADGLWGAKTAKAAADYVRAHGGPPGSHDETALMAQVAKHMPTCPQTTTATNTSSGSLEITGGTPEHAKSRREPLDGERKQLISQIANDLDGKRYEKRHDDDFFRVEYAVQDHQLAIDLEGTYLEGQYFCLNLERIHGASSFSDDEDGVEVDCRDCITMNCDINRVSLGNSIQVLFTSGTGVNPSGLANTLNRLASLNTDQSTLQCYERAHLGTIPTGAWRNSQGRITGIDAIEIGPPRGSPGEASNREELATHYQAAVHQCVVFNEHVMRDAHQNMVTAGRHVSDVENEKRRIRDYFQSQAQECQAEFMRRFEHFEPRMCD
ncbi:MAG: hypothetical protein OXF88_12735 [Rhodobacteraceae bacterium]|nr:hypothetical protein [Paracoccaceae bacterium]